MEQTLITEETLENGVTLRLYDASRKQIGDRWVVTLKVCALVPVADDDALEDEKTGDLLSVKQVLGGQITFEQKRERLFIDEQEKETLFNQMLENFQVSTRDYLAHPQFPSRFIKKSFRECLEQKRRDKRINHNQDG